MLLLLLPPPPLVLFVLDRTDLFEFFARIRLTLLFWLRPIPYLDASKFEYPCSLDNR